MKLGESQEFASPEEALNHHGVKGMHWGIRKDRETGSERTAVAVETATANESTKAYMIAAHKLNQATEPSEANFVKNKEKSLAKLYPDGSPPGTPKPPVLRAKANKGYKGLTPQQKKLLIGAGIGAGTLAGLYFVSKYTPPGQGINGLAEKLIQVGKKPKAPDHVMERARQAAQKGPPPWMTEMAGKPVGPDAFNGLVAWSQGKTWPGDNYFTPESFSRPEFEIPAGNLFHRLSTRAESEFTKPTYAIANVADWNRYATNFQNEKFGASEFHHITWKSTAPVKVPDLNTVLETLRTSLSETPGHGVINREQALQHYKDMSGGDWSNKRAQILVDALKKKGYGAVIDEMDAGVIGEKPLVFFSDAVTKKSNSRMTKADFTLAESKLIELTNRKA